ncbi:MAG: hypothetical protein U0168_18445 [Nannocystaceae bacterium]
MARTRRVPARRVHRSRQAHGRLGDPRRRGPGHDWCVLKLGTRGSRVLDIDTNHFLGNSPLHASVDAIAATPDAELEAPCARRVG